jgi:hypothetical protein
MDFLSESAFLASPMDLSLPTREDSRAIQNMEGFPTVVTAESFSLVITRSLRRPVTILVGQVSARQHSI